jgi:hypothetical protein
MVAASLAALTGRGRETAVETPSSHGGKSD